jgi:hypothetical protein
MVLKKGLHMKKTSHRNPRSQLKKMKRRFFLLSLGIFLLLFAVLSLAVSIVNLLLEVQPEVRLAEYAGIILVTFFSGRKIAMAASDRFLRTSVTPQGKGIEKRGKAFYNTGRSDDAEQGNRA